MSDTLWATGDGPSEELVAYTAAADRRADRRLLAWDVLGSLGHVAGLRAAGLIDAGEEERLTRALRAALADVRAGAFTVADGDEDCHTALERRLVAELGPLGEKLHTARSRNDQVLVALRLFTKDALLAVTAELIALAESLLGFAEAHRRIVWPGYTHMRRAMPSTVGLWAAGFAEALLDDLVPIDGALALTDRCPLGSAAGYGVPLRLRPEVAARVLGFAAPQGNVAAVQTSRGKLDVVVIAALWGVAYDLGKLSWDVILFSAEEYGFLVLPRELTTGSSIMPHKSNPDLFEMTRARSALVDGYLSQAVAACGRLPSGYHRDLQVLKGPLMASLDTVAAMVAAVCWALPRLRVDEERCTAALDGGVLATDEVYRRVGDGVPFRKAYREVAAAVAGGVEPPPVGADELLESRRYPGAPGNLGLWDVRRRLRTRRAELEQRREAFNAAMAALAGGDCG